MKTYYLLAVSFFQLFCSNNRSDQKINDTGNGVLIETVFPFPDIDTAKKRWVVLRYDPQYARIFEYRGYTCFQRNHFVRSLSKPEEISTKDYTSVLSTFFFTDSSSSAIYFDNNDLKTATVISKDSLLRKEWAYTLDNSPLFEDNETSLLELKQLDSDLESQTYLLKNKKDTSLTGTAQLILSRKDIYKAPYTFFKSIEQKTGMKLKKIIFVNNEKQLPGSDYLIEKITIPYEVKEFKIENDSALNAMYNKVKIMFGH